MIPVHTSGAQRRFRCTLTCTLALVFGAGSVLVDPVQAVEGANMMGRQAHNVGIEAVPAPTEGVSIDGRIDDWDLSGQTWTFADVDVRDRYSARTSVMWDKQHLYIAVDWRDPTPLYNTVNPVTDPNDGWRGDSLQMRVLADKPLWVTAWHFTPEQRSVFHLDYWKHPTNSREGMDRKLLIGEPGATAIGEGVQVAYRAHDDGQGYVQEMQIPWTVLYHETPPDIAVGQSLRIGFEYLWGDPTGRGGPIHRYADHLQPGETSREFFWSALDAWGNVTLRDQSVPQARTYIMADSLLTGTIPLRLEVPASATRFTLVIEDQQGRRIRNLAGDLSPLDYAIEVSADRRVLEVPWDGFDDHGRLVAAGTYRARGLTHEGLGAEYEMTFYNPGTPAWDTVEGDGAWGADHGAPRHVAAAGDWMIVGWPFAEGGSGIIGIDSEGRKRWGEKRGATALATDDEHVYAVASGWHTSGTLIRIGARDGSYQPFVLDGVERPFELPLADAIQLEHLDRPDGREAFARALAATRGEDFEVGKVSAMAAHDGKLAIALASGHLAILDSASAQLRYLFELPSASALAFAQDGRLFALVPEGVVQIDTASGDRSVLPITDLDRPTALTVDRDGHLVIADMGADKQIKAFATDGTLVYAAGRKGGRPIRGSFDPQAMMQVSSVAVDARNLLWAAEHTDYPRRVSVWNREGGTLVRDYIGNTGYAATGTFLHDQDLELAYVGPVEMKLDRSNRRWEVSRVLWVPGEGEHFPVSDSHTQPHRFRSEASGAMREYMFYPPYRSSHPWVLFMEMDDGDWQPVFAMGLVGALTGEIEQRGVSGLPEDAGDFSDLDVDDGFIWNDLNNDGRVRRDEIEVVRNQHSSKDARNGRGPLPTRCGWGNRMNPLNLHFYSGGRDTTYRIRPVDFRSNGAPMYSHESFEPLDQNMLGGQQDLVPAPKANVLLDIATLHCNGGVESARGIDLDTKEILWTYPNPFPGVHASHRATMPAPGLLIGCLKISGVAQINDEIGEVFALRGNLGQEFFLTVDGLFVGAMFRDTRLPREALPKAESQLIGMPMDTFSQGGEPFSGWMGSHDDGVIRMTSSMLRQAGVSFQLKGFDTISRFDAGQVQIDQDDLVAAERFAAERSAAMSNDREYTIVRREQSIDVDGQVKDWSGIKPLIIKSPASGYTGKAWVTYDDAHLYLAYEVNDPHPWRNRGRDLRRLFKTGDVVDLQIGTDPEADPERRDPVAGDQRVLIAPMADKPTAILMRPIDPAADREYTHSYTSPVGTRRFDRVQQREDIRTAATVGSGVYRVEAAIPLAVLGLKPEPGMALRGDIGFVTSNAEGTENTARTYWANPYTNLVNDEPQEAWFNPAAWGSWRFE